MKWRKVYIEITNYCNLSCSFCSKTSKPKREMTVDEFKQAIKKIKPYTSIIYLHIKGEPLLHSQFDNILKVCDEASLKVNITTNGTLLKEKIEILKKHPCLNHLNISLHSENKNIHYLENIFNSVEKLSTEVVIIYRFWTLNHYKINKKIANIVEKMSFYYNLSTEIVDKLKTEKNIKIRQNIYVDKANLFTWPDEKTILETEGYCLAGKTHIGIQSDGTVVPCCLDGEGAINLGNIFKDSIDMIISSKRYQDFIKGFQDRKPSESLCRKCRYKDRIKNN